MHGPYWKPSTMLKASISVMKEWRDNCAPGARDAYQRDIDMLQAQLNEQEYLLQYVCCPTFRPPNKKCFAPLNSNWYRFISKHQAVIDLNHDHYERYLSRGWVTSDASMVNLTTELCALEQGILYLRMYREVVDYGRTFKL